MEETLGKRIAFHRKRLGMTQERLAESLGITPQAVSKWENDQSCPDITALPRLAQIFGISTDCLLGVEPRTSATAETAPEADDAEPEGLHIRNGHLEFQWDGGCRSNIAIALWILLVGSLALANAFSAFGPGGPSLWTLVWTCGLLVFGASGLYPKFRFLHLACLLTGGYFLLNELNVISCYPQWKFILPGLLILLGFSLFLDALRKGKQNENHGSAAV